MRNESGRDKMLAKFDCVDPVSVYPVFFFFQAEDGIRDLTVTGVQTCALPIYQPQQNERFELRWALPSGYFVARTAGSFCRIFSEQQLLSEPIRAKLQQRSAGTGGDRKSTRLNSSHSQISYAVFCLKKKK